jgi:hypothetical protein
MTKVVDVPVGAVCKLRQLTCPALCVIGAPVVFYQQGMYDTCFFSSMAFAVYFADAKRVASYIQNATKGKTGCNVQRMFHALLGHIRQTELRYIQVTKLPPNSIGRMISRKA